MHIIKVYIFDMVVTQELNRMVLNVNTYSRIVSVAAVVQYKTLLKCLGLPF